MRQQDQYPETHQKPTRVKKNKITKEDMERKMKTGVETTQY